MIDINGYKPHKHQLAFHRSKAKFRAIISGIGGGKTLANMHEVTYYAVKHPGSIGYVLAPTYTMMKDTTLRTFFDHCPNELIAYYLKADHRVVLKNGSEVIFRSTEEPERLRGPNLDYFAMDEGSEMSFMTWKIMIGRLRGSGHGSYPLRAWITCTPKGFNWVWERFEKNKESGFEYFTFSSFENEHLPKEYLDTLKNGYSGAFYNQEVLGQFVGFEGLVYQEFNAQVHIQSIDPERKFKEVIAGIDWGWSNPSVIAVVGIDGDGRAYVLEEFYKSQTTVDEHIRIAQELKEKYNIVRFFADPSEPEHIMKFNNAGLLTVEAKNDVLPGIAKVSSMLRIQEDGKPRLIVNASCVKTINEFQMYRYPNKKEDRPVQENPMKMFDHAMDAIRYALFTSEPQGRILRPSGTR